MGDLILARDGAALLRARGETLAEGAPYCNEVQPCVDWSRLPVNGASHEDGVRYAEWLASSGRVPGARLCTDREWERAARGADDRLYPSSNGGLGPADACILETYGGNVQRARPCAAGTHPVSRSPFGVEDMIGSEWEWTASVPDIARPQGWLTRGASWADQGMLLVVVNRGVLATRGNYLTYGLRICTDFR
jgi:formylglycine-generating enzyme required for sulfatase activity